MKDEKETPLQFPPQKTVEGKLEGLIAEGLRPQPEAAASHTPFGEKDPKHPPLLPHYAWRGRRGTTLILAAAILSLLIFSCAKDYFRDAERAKNAREAMQQIWKGSQNYFQDRANWPKALDDLMDRDYVDVDSVTLVQWNFTLTGDPLATIEATSTDEMPGGQGHTVTFDVNTNKFSGYGVHE